MRLLARLFDREQTIATVTSVGLRSWLAPNSRRFPRMCAVAEE
ncbi:hypothetical protein GA0061103_2410 [Rhizobium multihospitium]|uniref:Uncharacterized protein n=1 Tax=Rhizobium multihospitium TaxID=410764 RepID=A0A1C3UPH5_9HYPH|nr:hypothetical protein GA0061103_2410 [Rhizobium multihospitium]